MKSSAPDLLRDLAVPVCPYTGLRTFTEDEAIYFRGRETHIGKCIELLARQHFLMITGASGDGKSSLVYAGLLPEIRAGFFRARFSNWSVCTFRPERQPLHNLARALAAGLHLERSAEAVETQLQQGFSALVDLYQASPLCPAEGDEAPAAAGRHSRREAANLLLVLDQFEEFFTNAENYAGDAPTAAAQTVVNLLLETTRLARERGLPIYVVCTMRSDFIGQCAEFRGLVELIGESQYFVPRLTRAEFVEIVQEPAVLSGNRIADRLVQRLVDDNRDGRDQLPVLQHALYQIWQAADQGREELDLVHYAMVGGMPAIEIPWEDQGRFATWRAALPPVRQLHLLARPSLHNVLDAHADQLYTEAAARYNAAFGPALAPGTAERIVATAFRALTKMDAHRVVRNRMTGAELTAILNDPALPWPVVCRVLRPFRQPGNTFLSPFLWDGDDDTAALPPDAVLDITHESLIRNWQRLATWASQEADDVRTVGQLTVQAQSWASHARDKGYLLPIGPYSQFAKWHRRKQPNANWLTYYVADGGTGSAQHPQAEAQSTLIGEFLARSQRRLWFSLLVARYGAGNLATYVLGPLIFAALIWFGWSQHQRTNEYVAYSIIEQRLPFLTSPYVEMGNKARLVIEADRLDKFASGPEDYRFASVLNRLPSDTLALDLELEMFAQVSNVQYDTVARENPLIRPVLLDLNQRLRMVDHAARGSAAAARAPGPAERRLAIRAGRYVMALTYYLAWTTPTPALPNRPDSLQHRDTTQRWLATLKTQWLEQLRQYTAREIQATAGPPPVPAQFNYCLRVLLAQGDFSAAQLAFLGDINPFDAATKPAFERIYPRRTRLLLGVDNLNEWLGHGGGYLSYALMAAALHEPSDVIGRCMDSLRINSNFSGNSDFRRFGKLFFPYAAKYGAISSNNSYKFLKKCCYSGDSEFMGLFAMAAYESLAIEPSQSVLTFLYHDKEKNSDILDYFNVDLVSFSLKNKQRENLLAALQAAVPEVAAHENVFKSEFGPTNESLPNLETQEAFLQAFLCKMQAIYCCGIKRSKGAGQIWFESFDEQLARFVRDRHPWTVFPPFWDGFLYTFVGTEADKEWLTAEAFLTQVIQPKTDFGSSFRACSFSSFFEHMWITSRPDNDRGLADRLKKTVYSEAVSPNSNSWLLNPGSPIQERIKYALQLPKFDVPNRRWINWLRELPASEKERKRDAFLQKIIADTKDRTALLTSNVKRNYVADAKLFFNTPEPFRTSLFMALSNLASGFGRYGQYDKGFQVAELLPVPFATMTKLRVAEQAMLEGKEGNDQIGDFLKHYRAGKQKNLPATAGSAVSLYCWQAYQRGNAERNELENQAHLVIKEGAKEVQDNGIDYLCRGRTLAGDAYQAVRDIPDFVPENRRQTYFNTVLTNLAHLDRPNRRDGWEEYDNERLLSPSDYTRDDLVTAP